MSTGINNIYSKNSKKTDIWPKKIAFYTSITDTKWKGEYKPGGTTIILTENLSSSLFTKDNTNLD